MQAKRSRGVYFLVAAVCFLVLGFFSLNSYFDDWLQYVPVIIGAASGLVGILSGPDGSISSITRTKKVLVILIFVSAVYGVYDVWLKDVEKDKSVKIQLEEREKLEMRLAEAKRVLELDSFDLTFPVEQGLLYFSIGLDEGGEPIKIPGFSGIFPTFGRSGVMGELSLNIDTVMEYRFEFKSREDGSVQITREGGRVQLWMEDVPHCYQNTDGICEDGEWWVDLIAPSYTHGVTLSAKATMHKLAARALEMETYGSIVVDDPLMKESDYNDALIGFKKIEPDIKFYAPMRRQISTDCPSVIHLPVAFEVSEQSRVGKVVIDIVPIQGRFATVECEDSPI